MHVADPAEIPKDTPSEELCLSTEYSTEACADANISLIRSYTPYRVFLWLLMLGLFVEAGITVIFGMLGHADDNEVFFAFLMMFFTIQLVWAESKVLGENIGLPRVVHQNIEDTRYHGFNFGPVRYVLSRDAIEWTFDNNRYAYHTSMVRSAFSKGRTMFFRMTNAEWMIMVVGKDSKHWAKQVKTLGSKADAEGWSLPADWNAFDYPMSDYLERAKIWGPEEPDTGVFAITSTLVLTLLGMITLWLLEPNVLLGVLATAPLVYLASIQISERALAKKRKRTGLGPSTRCLPGVTHGPTRYRLSHAQLEIARTHFSQQTKTKCISEAQESRGWIDLLLGGRVIQTLPATQEVKDWLSDIGLICETGPWARSDGAIEWKRAAPCL